MLEQEKVLELLEEDRELVCRFEEVTQEMLTCTREQLEEKMRERERILGKIKAREEALGKLCQGLENGAEVLEAAHARADISCLAEELRPIYEKALEVQAVLSRFPESEVQAMMRVKQEQERILEQIKAANKGGAAKAARFYSMGRGQSGGTKLGRA